jgi:hypothetical protein
LPALFVVIAGVLIAAVPMLALAGFTVDDALIVARYAHNLASGAGYRFNPRGLVTDGVTPLGFAHLLAPFARDSVRQAFVAAQAIGAVAWLSSAAVLTTAVRRTYGSGLRFLALALIAASAPIAAWSMSGLETGLVLALATLGVSLRAMNFDRSGTVAAGLAAGFRPELLPWAFFVAVAPRSTDSRWRVLGRGSVAMAPFIVVALVRRAWFGQFAPLSIVAKAPDASLGFRYAAACFLLAGPIALVAPRAWMKAGNFARGLGVALVAHFVAVGFAGGDWMPLSRLFVPVLPTVVLLVAELSAFAAPWSTVVRVTLAVAAELFVMVRVGPAASKVGAARAVLIEDARPHFSGAEAVASIDVGWVGCATEGTVVDLAGVTDPAIARLSGGHTSKRITPGLLDERRVDRVVLLLEQGAELAMPWTASRFARVAERRIASFTGVLRAFEVDYVTAPGAPRYVILRRVAPRIEGTERDVVLDPSDPLGL